MHTQTIIIQEEQTRTRSTFPAFEEWRRHHKPLAFIIRHHPQALEAKDAETELLQSVCLLLGFEELPLLADRQQILDLLVSACLRK